MTSPSSPPFPLTKTLIIPSSAISPFQLIDPQLIDPEGAVLSRISENSLPTLVLVAESSNYTNSLGSIPVKLACSLKQESDEISIISPAETAATTRV